jgi:CRP-like cAMP-binding protein
MLNSYKNESGYAVKSVTGGLGIGSSSIGTTVKESSLNKWKQLSKDTFSINEFTNSLILSGLPSDDFARLLPHLQTVSVVSGENIYHSGDEGYYVYFPETAVFSQLNVLEDGRTVETAMIGNEGFLGISTVLSCEENTTPWTQAIIGGSVLRINAAIFKNEFNNGGFLHSSFLEYLNLYIRQISQKALCNNHHLIEERFSTWLLMLDDRCEKNALVLTHEQIAHFLGVHRPSVTCIAQDLRNKGIIDYCRGRINILDRQKLELSACECYRVIN